jgi:hypothetical protein
VDEVETVVGADTETGGTADPTLDGTVDGVLCVGAGASVTIETL